MATAYNTNSGIHQLPSNCYPASESDDEDSFVVLNNSLGPDGQMDHTILNTEPISTHTIQASLDSIADILTQQTLQNKETGNLTTVDSSHISYQSTDISADEIQNKVDNLIADNSKHKDTVAQNNIAMKKLVDMIMQWQAEVQRVQESHKEKFSDMKKYITILKAEKENLQGLVKKFENQTVDENTKKAELEASQKKIKELEKALDIYSIERESLSKEVSAKQVELINVIADKKLLIYELDLSKKKEIELNATATEVQFLKDENVKLRDANNNLADEILKLQNQNEKLRLDMAEREEKLTAMQGVLCDFEQDLSQKEQQLMVSEIHITELKEFNAKNISLKDQEIIALNKNMKTLQINVDEIAALRTQLELYKNDYEVERQQREELLNERNKIADDLKQLQINVDEIAALRTQLELHKNDYEVERQQREELLNEIAALRTQLELYENDHEVERQQREELLNERNIIADDFQQLQTRNIQLLEEVDQLRSGFVAVKKEEVRALTATEATLASALVYPNAAWNGPLAGGLPASQVPAEIRLQACPHYPKCAKHQQYNPNPYYNQPTQPQFNTAPEYNPGPQYNAVPQYNQVPQYNSAPQNSQIQKALNRGGTFTFFYRKSTTF